MDLSFLHRRSFSRRVVRALTDRAALSWSQMGEDLIMATALGWLGIPATSYLDVGAHHPTQLSNTYLFYLRGVSGVCVEPNPDLLSAFASRRPKDTVINVAVGAARGETVLYVATDAGLSTTSEEQRAHLDSVRPGSMAKSVRVETVCIMDIVERYFPSEPPTLVSLDVEGDDLGILRALDFSRCRPPVWCIETLTYDDGRSGRKIEEIKETMISAGYFSFADTWLNTIFVDRYAWERGKSLRAR